MTWKIDIVEGLAASLRYQSFKAQLHILSVNFKKSASNLYHFYWYVNAFTIIMVKIRVDLMETDKMKVGS